MTFQKKNFFKDFSWLSMTVGTMESRLKTSPRDAATSLCITWTKNFSENFGAKLVALQIRLYVLPSRMQFSVLYQHSPALTFSHNHFSTYTQLTYVLPPELSFSSQFDRVVNKCFLEQFDVFLIIIQQLLEMNFVDLEKQQPLTGNWVEQEQSKFVFISKVRYTTWQQLLLKSSRKSGSCVIPSVPNNKHFVKTNPNKFIYISKLRRSYQPQLILKSSWNSSCVVGTNPVATGGLWWANAHKWNTINHWSFYHNFNIKLPPGTNVKPP